MVKVFFNFTENLRYGILALGSLAEHILLADRGIKTDTGYACALLSAGVLFLHHKVEFIECPP